MTGDQNAADLDAEREVDLRGWWKAFRSRWWIALIGLGIGILIGAVYSLNGGTSYTADALIARGQAFNPGGNTTVLSYLSSPAAIQAFATSEAALRYAAAKAGMSVGELRGHVRTSTVGDTGTSSQTNTNSVLVQLTVVSNKPKRAQDAANALAELVKKQTTSHYVTQSIAIYEERLASFAVRLSTLKTRIKALNTALESSSSLSPLDKLVVASELDSAQAALGQTLDSQTTTQQLLTLAQEVEQTQIVQLAKSQKSTARSRRNSVLFGGLIGLLAGSIVALIVGLRAARPAAPAAA
jgi:uncharacterized protein involved in exopolysaccharide biosynthesis